MKNFLQAFALLFLVALGFAPAANAATDATVPSAAPADFNIVILPGSTTVSLELNQHVSSYELETGHMLDFTVAQDVMVNGEVVIRTGAMAEGRVRSVKHPTQQSPFAEITIEVKSVTAVDGSRVNLAGNPHRVRARMYGAAAEVELITRLTARVQRDVEIML